LATPKLSVFLLIISGKWDITAIPAAGAKWQLPTKPDTRDLDHETALNEEERLIPDQRVSESQSHARHCLKSFCLERMTEQECNQRFKTIYYTAFRKA